MKRNPLDKQTFFSGVRQKWAAIFLLCGLGVLVCNMYNSNIDPSPYMNFLIVIGSIFILGGSVDSALKIQKASPEQKEQILHD